MHKCYCWRSVCTSSTRNKLVKILLGIVKGVEHRFPYYVGRQSSAPDKSLNIHPLAAIKNSHLTLLPLIRYPKQPVIALIIASPVSVIKSHPLTRIFVLWRTSSIYIVLVLCTSRERQILVDALFYVTLCYMDFFRRPMLYERVNYTVAFTLKCEEHMQCVVSVDIPPISGLGEHNTIIICADHWKKNVQWRNLSIPVWWR